MRMVVYLWHLLYVHVIWGKKMTIKYSVKMCAVYL